MARLARSVAVLGTASLIAVAPTAASAQVTQLSVTNLASPALPSEVPQPPVVIAASGSCAAPMTVAGPCPAGTWPAIDGDWGASVAVAGGDTLQLAFDAPVDGVLVASTSKLPPGLTDPDGHAVPNEDALPATAATRVDAMHWTVPLPAVLTPRSSNGLTLSVVASDPGGSHDFALGLISPRPSRYGLGCEGNTYYFFGPDYRSLGCPRDAMPPGLPQTPPAGGAPVSAPKPAVHPALTGAPRWTTRGLRLTVKLPAQTPATLAVRAGKALLGRTAIEAAAETERVVVVPVRASDRQRHARTFRVTLAATGLQRVDTTLKATRWPRLRIG
jgi:hypothetical protein